MKELTKELTIEEKAQAYDEAIINGSRLWECNEITRENYEYIFPKFRESEDDIIRKEIIEFIKVSKPYWKNYRDYSSWITWLEKQSTQKSADKIKSMFNVGDWLQYRNAKPFLVKEITEYGYVNGDSCLPFDWENEIHLWTIQDAKDGDILFHSDTASNGIFIFKEILQRGNIQEVICYCDYDSEDGFRLGEKHTCCWTHSKILHPATKEQRDTLFAKIKKAGYKWNAEKKELKKIHVIDEGKDELDYCFTKMMNDKSVSSTLGEEEDENKISSIKYLLHELNNYNFDNWLDSLKCKPQYNKPFWSEKDIKGIERIVYILDGMRHYNTVDNKQEKPYQSEIDFLNSIKDRYTWKPNDEQEPNWCHHKVDLSDCSEEYRKAYYDGWNNCNMQHSQCESEKNDVLKCLINGMKFYYEDNEEATWGTEKFSIKVKDILSWLEKQEDTTNSLLNGLDKAHERIDGLIQKNNILIEQLEKNQDNMKDILNIMLDKSLLKETKESWNKFLDEQDKQKSEKVDNLHNYLYGEQNQLEMK